MAEILIAFVVEVLFTVGIIAVGGLLVSLCSKLFYANLGARARAVCYMTGALGTPVHELSHALFCVIFGHKVVEIKLFQIDDESGTLGYVKHTYNPKNVYHKMGNFFIGIAPILVISALLFLFAWTLIPETVRSVTETIGSVSLGSGVGRILRAYGKAVGAFFSGATNRHWWIFILVGAFFSLHMTLSVADIKGALSGLLLVLLVLLIMNGILRIIGVNLLYGTMCAIVNGGVFLSVFLVIALLIDVVWIALALLYRLAKSKILKKPL